MEPLYNVYFAGEVLDGQDLTEVRRKVANLFNADEATLNKLFNGKLQLIKRDCDKAAALKYKQALEQAGARPIIKAAETTEAAPAPADTAPRPQTAAEKIAALAAAPDLKDYQATPEPQPEPTAQDEFGVELAPPETEVLKPEERQAPVVREVDTGSLALDTETELLSEPSPPPPPPPEVSHLSMGEVGEDIPTLDTGEAPVAPNTDALSLSPEGTDFSDCTGPEPIPPTVDLSALEVAPEGSDVLDERYRKKEPVTPPATDHIELEK